MTSPITLTIQSQISGKQITYTNINAATLLAVVQGSRSRSAKELTNRLLPVIEDLAR